uniref:Ubiquinol-cytochrome c reductase, 6.4kDa subunit n=1 Tax=Pongo abelii TaxID=9601 RepID=H2NWU9_PONAB
MASLRRIINYTNPSQTPLVPGGASSSHLSVCCIWSSPSLRMDKRKSTAQLQISYVSENSLDILMHVALNLTETCSVPGC